MGQYVTTFFWFTFVYVWFTKVYKIIEVYNEKKGVNNYVSTPYA